jgi:exodeoxyribonuclease V alpha subunit
VVIPLVTQHYMLTQRNLIYTGVTRGKRLLLVIGQKKVLGIAVGNDRTQRWYSGSGRVWRRARGRGCRETLQRHGETASDTD